MIQVRELSKFYGDTLALKNVSFEVPQGKVVGLLGLNGAGKTSCLRVLSAYLIPSEGSCLIDGVDVFEHPMKVKKKIGYLPEIPPLYPELSVGNYLLFVARMRGLEDARFEEEWERVSKLSHIENIRYTLIRHLSLGYRKRVGIAQALIASPRVLIFDEPISGLDPVQIIEIRKLIRSLAGDYTILISSHILTEVSRTCDRVIIIHKGKLVQELEGEALDKDLEKQFIDITESSK